VSLDSARFLDFYLKGAFKIGKMLDVLELFEFAIKCCAKTTARMLLEKYLDHSFSVGNESNSTLRQDLSSEAERLAVVVEMMHAVDRQKFPENSLFRTEQDVLDSLDIYFGAIAAHEKDLASFFGGENSCFDAVIAVARVGYLRVLHEILAGRFQRILTARPIRESNHSDKHEPGSDLSALELLEAYCNRNIGMHTKEVVHRNGRGVFALFNAIFDPNLDGTTQRIRRILPQFRSARLKHIIKDVDSLSRLEKLGVVTPDHSFIPWLLSIPGDFVTPGFPFTEGDTTTTSSAIRWQTVRSLAYVLGYAEKQTGVRASASDLMLAIQRASPTGPLAGSSGIVRLLLLYGADPKLLDIATLVPSRNRPEIVMLGNRVNPSAEVYRGLNTDIKHEKYWKRWIDERSIFDLPPEVWTEIMMCLWED